MELHRLDHDPFSEERKILFISTDEEKVAKWKEILNKELGDRAGRVHFVNIEEASKMVSEGVPIASAVVHIDGFEGWQDFVKDLSSLADTPVYTFGVLSSIRNMLASFSCGAKDYVHNPAPTLFMLTR